MVIDTEVEVEVRSADVPNIDLVDLPGLVEVVSDQEADLPELSVQCTREYLTKVTTGAVVCVLDASMNNLRTSKVLRLLREAPDYVKNHTIGVFSKADKAYDPGWETLEDKFGPFWNLEERIHGTALDYEGSEPFLGVRRGFVAVFNRDTLCKHHQARSLKDHNLEELQWKSKHFGQSDEKIQDCIGLDNLIELIDKVICGFLSKEWVP